MNNIEISIILPVYNVEKYLDDCLDSIAQQDNSSYEILAIDDGSTDNGLQILNYRAQKDSRIRVFSQRNKGVASARNVGLRNAIGQYVLFVDGDDLLCPTALSALHEIIEKNNPDIVSFGLMPFSETLSTSADEGNSQKIFQINKQQFFDLIYGRGLKTKYPISGFACTKIFKRALLHDQFFNENLKLHEDENFFANLALILPENARILVLDAPLYGYRERATSLVHTHNLVRLQNLYSSRRAIHRICPENSKQKSTAHQARLEALIKLMRYSLQHGRHGGFKLFRRIVLSEPKLPIRVKLTYFLGLRYARNRAINRARKKRNG